ncbi:uncharacterized protein [Fopius arisanus]|uniref:Uncharacterized protein n=1 Tax=Fopius arisanus TaxID=64838 RepID=A0A9R1T5M3_9HYME|nr:PREDICTED: uncharacterized protein LOC105266446 [Fopius arisanus]
MMKKGGCRQSNMICPPELAYPLPLVEIFITRRAEKYQDGRNYHESLEFSPGGTQLPKRGRPCKRQPFKLNSAILSASMLSEDENEWKDTFSDNNEENELRKWFERG